jgi:hypothetical protein
MESSFATIRSKFHSSDKPTKSCTRKRRRILIRRHGWEKTLTGNGLVSHATPAVAATTKMLAGETAHSLPLGLATLMRPLAQSPSDANA